MIELWRPAKPLECLVYKLLVVGRSRPDDAGVSGAASFGRLDKEQKIGQKKRWQRWLGLIRCACYPSSVS